MPLPSAVQKIGEAADRQAVEQGMKGAPAPAATQGEPPTGGEPTVAQPAPAPVQTVPPAAKQTEDEDWKTRYTNLRNERETSKATVERQIEQINSLQEMLSDSQKQVKDLMAKIDTLVEKSVPQPSEDEVQEAKYQKWLKNLPAHYREEYEEKWLREQYGLLQTMIPSVQPQTDPDLVKRVESAEKKVEENTRATQLSARERYNQEMDQAFPNDEWITMTNSKDVAWSAFCEKSVSPVDQRTYGQILSHAHDSSDYQSAIWVLTQFKTQRDSQGAGEQPGNPLETQLTPEGGAGGDPVKDLSARTETFTVSEVNEFYNQRAKDIGKANPMYTPEQAKAIEQNIQAAQQAGTILPG